MDPQHSEHRVARFEIEPGSRGVSCPAYARASRTSLPCVSVTPTGRRAEQSCGKAVGDLTRDGTGRISDAVAGSVLRHNAQCKHPIEGMFSCPCFVSVRQFSRGAALVRCGTGRAPAPASGAKDVTPRPRAAQRPRLRHVGDRSWTPKPRISESAVRAVRAGFQAPQGLRWRRASRLSYGPRN